MRCRWPSLLACVLATGCASSAGDGLVCDADAPASTTASCVLWFWPGPGSGHGQSSFPDIVYGGPTGIDAHHQSLDVLSLGRRDRAHPEALPLADFVREFLDEFTLHGEAEKAQIAVTVPAGLTLAFDRAHLHQILWNLLGNARRYASARAGAITVHAEARDGRTEVHIADDGPGIGATHLGQLFEPFFTTHAKGTGLGLYIARELAEANRASLNLIEGEGGAHFCLSGMSEP